MHPDVFAPLCDSTAEINNIIIIIIIVIIIS